jgi:hypothetical protein
MKKLTLFIKISLAIQIAGIIYGVVEQSWEMIILCSVFFIICFLELNGKINKQ